MSTIPELKFLPGARALVKHLGRKGTVSSGYYSEVRQVTTYTVKMDDGSKVTALEEGLEPLPKEEGK